MSSALIGYSGFVGRNLALQCAFDDYFNSRNIEEIAGRRYDLIVCAGAPGAKWLANRDPQKDRESIDRLTECLDRVVANHVVLISTVDVYRRPVDVDESTIIVDGESDPYGRHRRQLELAITERFENTIVRLPALFGPGLNKNAIYDILHGHRVEWIHPASEFQFYPTARLWKDIESIRECKLPLMNLATEPASIGSIAVEVFGLELSGAQVRAEQPVRYDMKTAFAASLGMRGDYILERGEVLHCLHEYVASVGWTRA